MTPSQAFAHLIRLIPVCPDPECATCKANDEAVNLVMGALERARVVARLDDWARKNYDDCIQAKRSDDPDDGDHESWEVPDPVSNKTLTGFPTPDAARAAAAKAIEEGSVG